MRGLVKTKTLSCARKALGLISVFIILLHSEGAFAQQLEFVVDEITAFGLNQSQENNLKNMFLGTRVELQFFSSGDVVRISGGVVPSDAPSICNLSGREGILLLPHTLVYECSVDEERRDLGIKGDLRVKRIGRFVRSASYSLIRLDRTRDKFGFIIFELKRM